MKCTVTLYLIVVYLFFPSLLLSSEEHFGRSSELSKFKPNQNLIKVFSTLIKQNPSDYQAYNKRGVVWFYNGDYDKAILDYTRALSENLNYAEAYSNRGVAWFFKGNFAQAIYDFTAAVNIKPRFFEAYCFRGDAWYKKEKFDQAISDYNTALEIYPQYARAYNNRGFIWFRKGEYGLAISDYSSALEINPDYAEACSNLSWLLSTCADEQYRNGEKAVKLAERAVEINPSETYMDTLAAALAEKGKFNEAVSMQEKAIDLYKKAGGKVKLAQYRERLNSYKNNKPWRQYFIIRKTIKYEEKKIEAKSARVIEHNESKRVIRKKSHSKLRRTYPYTIQISSYREKEKSNTKAMELRKAGDMAFTSYADIPGKGVWHRIFIGFYTSESEAEKAAAKLKKRNFPYADVRIMPYAVQAGSSESDQELKKIEADLMAKGYIPQIAPDRNDSRKSRLLIGAFKTEEKAEVVAKRLKEKGFNAKIVRR
jgi:tetratricopeptide (TPR) repeat protein